MPFNLFLLPLLSGFLFTRHWNVTKYETLRSENERLLLLSSVWGGIFLAIAFAITSFARPKFPNLVAWWNGYVPFEYMGTACLAFLLGALGWKPLNWFSSREQQISKLIEENGDRFELLLKKAMDQEKMVSVTLKNGKAYFGFVKAALNPANTITSVGILPTRSGYRHPDTKTLVFTSEYSTIFDQLIKEYDAKEKEVEDIKRELAKITSQRNKRAEDLEKVSGEARPDMIMEPNLTQVQGELEALDEEIDRLHAQIVNLENEMDLISKGLEDYETVFPVSEICILSIYNHRLYQKYFATQRGE